MNKSTLIVGFLSWVCFCPASLQAVPDFGNTYNVNLFRQAGDIDDTAPIQRAIDAAGAAGRGIVYLPAGTYTISSSLQMGKLRIFPGRPDLQLDGYSNIWMHGDGVGQTVLKCTSALDAHDPLTHNDVINAVNLFFHQNPGGGGDTSAYADSLWFSNMTIDASEQNNLRGPQAPAPNLFGYSLAAIELQNVHNARAFNLEIIGAFGNGIVIASIDPGKEAAVINGRIENVIFRDCIRGILLNYGITGSVIQYGAMKGGVISSSTFLNSGGPAIDLFNSSGTVVENNVFTGANSFGCSRSTNPDCPRQTKNSIHSDFGLENCIIRNNVMDGAGPIYLNGNMTPDIFFNDRVPTPGPQGCQIVGNTLRNTVVPPGSGYGAMRLVAGNTPDTHETVRDNLIEGNIIVSPPANACQLVDARANTFRANEILHFNAPAFMAFGQFVPASAHNFMQRNITLNFGNIPNGANFIPVQWTTDELARSQVEYGLTPSHGQSTNLDQATPHTQNLTGLVMDTFYHYQVKSFDAQGNAFFSHDYLFWFPATVVPTITSPGSATGEVGTYFSYTITATNNPSSFKTADFLPPGLSLNETTGVISGTPTVSATSTNRMLAFNSKGAGDTPLTLTIRPLSAPVINSPHTATGEVGAYFSYKITATGSPASFSMTPLPLPLGLSLDATTGVISGTPTVAVTYNGSMSATNSAGPGSAPWTLTIILSPPVILSPTTATGEVGKYFTYTITATGFPTSFSTTALLPEGLSLNATTGVISGTPTLAGIYTGQFMRAHNSAGMGSNFLTLTILLSSPVITSPTSATGEVGRYFTYTITATGNPTRFNTTALLPPGLSGDATTGVISGTPTAAGTHNNFLLATNSAGTGSAPWTLTISSSTPPAPILNLPRYMPVDARISATYNASGFGSPDYFLWSFEPTNSPSGAAARIPSNSENRTTQTRQPQLDLGPLGIQAGTYRVAVTAYFSNALPSLTASAIVTLVSTDLAAVRVSPNPWRSDRHFGHNITFDHLPNGSRVKIFTIAGHWVQTLPPSTDTVEWDLTNHRGELVASGIYLFLIDSDQGEKKTGQIAIIR